MERILIHTVSEQEYQASENHSLRRFLSVQLHLSRHSISRLKFSNSLLINGKPAHVSMNVQPGDEIKVILERDSSRCEDREDRAEQKIVSEGSKGMAIRKWIRYEDADLLIVNKPSGIPVHASHGHLEDSLGTAIAKEYQAQGEEFTVRTVGRLDKDVSGLVLFAKNRFAAQVLWKEREEKQLSKTYLAIAEGIMEQPAGTIDLPLRKVEGQRQRVTDEAGKPSVTHFCVRGRYDHVTLLEVTIETGRTHQIRSHLAAIGHPLAGDGDYGGNTDKIKRPALHCAQIRVVQPFTGNLIVVDEELPEDMKDLLTIQEGF